MRKRNRMLRFGFVVAIVAVVGLIAADAWSQVGREKALVEKAAAARMAMAPIANANEKRERETDAPVKRAPAELAVGGITREERVARHNKLHARLIAEMPVDALEDPITVKLTEQDRADLAGPYESGTPLRIGVVKAISPGIRVEQGKGFKGGVTQETADGGFVWAVTVTSPDAEAIRVHFTNFSLPPNAEIFFFSPDGAVDGPYVGAGRNGNGDFWTRSLSSDTGVIQLRFSGKGAPGARQEISFAVSELAHIHDRKHLEPDEGRGHDTWPCSNNAVCLVDANCVSGTPADPAKDAVAKMEWISGPSVFTCSGGLLVDTVPASQIPYFLTANHCMSASIANLETWFNYTTDSCNGICPHNILTGGAPPSDTIGFTVLASSATSDFTLGTLDQAPPAGALFLGWNNSPVAFTNGAQLHRISNANFGPQVYSQQDVDTGSPVCGGLARGNFIYSDTNTGGTMGGSSGSPVVNAASEVVGQLFGCCGFNCADECASAPTNWTVDGAFAVTFPSVEEFLDPPTECTTDPDCDDADPCTTDTCSGGFCSNTPISCPPGEICVGGVCEGAGACCVGTTCTIETVSDCAASGGTYQGNGSPCGSGQAGDPTIYTSSPNVSIPDGGGPGNPATDTINVTDSVIIGDVDVDLDITHTWVGDLTVLVSHLGT
ncbi:MAG: hypothetical protein IH897_08515, partial [Planctomycetes bacterium]|nr:hypothetical protein [Planctomycetota bacterium]